ncbi:MAG: hypothetical protein RLZZ454_562, partial [Pseudomonadota bacterium]
IAPLAAHQAPSADLSSMLLLAFFSFSLCASAVYIANDLFDLDSDRHHPRKRLRPFASGRVSVAKGVVLFPLLLLNAFLFAIPIGSAFVGWLLFYFLLTCAYSWGLKRVVLIDCLVLAMLYTVRIIAGAAAAGASVWLVSPCFSPPISISPPLLKMNKAKPAKMAKAKIIFHIRFPSKKRPSKKGL